MDEDVKRILKKDSDQLKKDLDSKPKIIQKREVPISFGKKTTTLQNKTTKITKNAAAYEDFLKNQLNI